MERTAGLCKKHGVRSLSAVVSEVFVWLDLPNLKLEVEALLRQHG
jgi:hypothetical protein